MTSPTLKDNTLMSDLKIIILTASSVRNPTSSHSVILYEPHRNSNKSLLFHFILSPSTLLELPMWSTVRHWHFLNGSTNHVLVSEKTLTGKINCNFPMNTEKIIVKKCLKTFREQKVPQIPKATSCWLLLCSLKGIRSHWASDQNIDLSRSHLPVIHGDIN